MFVFYCIRKHEEYSEDTIYKIRLDTCVVSSILQYGVDTIRIQLLLNTRRIHGWQDTFSYPSAYVFCRIQHTVRILNEYERDTRTRYTYVHIHSSLRTPFVSTRLSTAGHSDTRAQDTLKQTFIVATSFGSGIATSSGSARSTTISSGQAGRPLPTICSPNTRLSSSRTSARASNLPALRFRRWP